MVTNDLLGYLYEEEDRIKSKKEKGECYNK